MKRFEPGVTYKTRSITDADCVISLTVRARTAKTIQAIVDGKPGVQVLRITIRDGAETVKPWGSYSLAPTIRASGADEPAAIEVSFTSKLYQPDAVRARYVRADAKGGGYSWCEVGDDRRYDLRQGTVKGEALPKNIRDAADQLRGTFPAYIDWPFENKEN